MHGLLTFFGNQTNHNFSEYITIWNSQMIWSGYKKEINSPYNIYNVLENDVFIEGNIYNYSEKQIVSSIESIISANNYDRNQQIKYFIDKADGEFLIQITDRKKLNTLIIVDKYARVPFYYYARDENIILTRNINEVLRLSNQNELDIQAIYEYLTFEFFLGNKTFIKNVFRIEPYEFIEIIKENGDLKLRVGKLGSLSYDSRNWKNKKKFLNEYYKRFEEAVNNRLKYLHNIKEAKVESTLSGGFDTRAIFGQLNKLNVNANYYTYEYTQDESIIARNLMLSVEDNNKYIKLNFDNSYDELKSRDYLFECQGLATSQTCYVCCKDSSSVANITGNKPIWGGFGGEYIRHPYKRKYKDLFNTLNCGLLTFDLYEYDSIIKKINGKNFRLNLKNYFNMYTEKTFKGKMKHFYNEYYIHRVGNGEDLWGRRYNWTIHPMIAKPLIDLFLEMPLKYASYNTFKKFLSRINPKLLSVDIYNDSFKLSSKYFFLKDVVISIKNIILICIQGRFPFIWKYLKNTLSKKIFQNKINHVTTRDIKILLYHFSIKFFKNPFLYLLKIIKEKNREDLNQPVNTTLEKRQIPFYDEIVASPLVNVYFNLDKLFFYLEKQENLYDNRLFSLIIYILEIEKRQFSVF